MEQRSLLVWTVWLIWRAIKQNGDIYNVSSLHILARGRYEGAVMASRFFKESVGGKKRWRRLPLLQVHWQPLHLVFVVPLRPCGGQRFSYLWDRPQRVINKEHVTVGQSCWCQVFISMFSSGLRVSSPKLHSQLCLAMQIVWILKVLNDLAPGVLTRQWEVNGISFVLLKTMKNNI